MEKKEKFKLTEQLWAKILAFVLLGVFAALLAAGIGEAVFSMGAMSLWDSEQEFINDILIENHGYSTLTQAESLYAQGLLITVYDWAYWWLPMVLVGAVGALACLVFAFTAAGHRKGVEGVRLNVFDKLPLDLYLVLCWTAAFAAL